METAGRSSDEKEQEPSSCSSSTVTFSLLPTARDQSCCNVSEPSRKRGGEGERGRGGEGSPGP